VGHVKATKGIYEIIEAAEMFDSNVVVDIYGPLDEGVSDSAFRGGNVHYKGQLDSAQVISTMRQYDGLLMPTYYVGEGYPGVILEAYCAGVPVIATRWRSIPEIVDETSGILIEPKSAEQLAQAMQELINSSEKRATRRRGALTMARRFSSQAWTEKFVQINNAMVDSK
jgi:glycosyltransferase involved in cell wall biosynthesis